MEKCREGRSPGLPEVHLQFELLQETLYMRVAIIDRWAFLHFKLENGKLRNFSCSRLLQAEGLPFVVTTPAVQ
jgi:hypothetical protein